MTEAAQREQRRRERARFSFSDAAYQHYNPRHGGYGSQTDWRAAAEALAAGRGFFKGAPGTRKVRNPDLECLGLDETPADIAGLKSAFRRAAMRTHPDHGGTNAAFRAVYAAYERLVRLY